MRTIILDFNCNTIWIIITKFFTMVLIIRCQSDNASFIKCFVSKTCFCVHTSTRIAKFFIRIICISKKKQKNSKNKKNRIRYASTTKAFNILLQNYVKLKIYFKIRLEIKRRPLWYYQSVEKSAYPRNFISNRPPPPPLLLYQTLSSKYYEQEIILILLEGNKSKNKIVERVIPVVLT